MRRPSCSENSLAAATSFRVLFSERSFRFRVSTIKATPTDGLSYNPSEELYWRADALEQEVTRVFDICHGCRLCFNLCPSFPTLFDKVDANDGDVRQLTKNDRDEVVDGCFQCKLCYVKCPYTVDDGHEFNLDFPRLLLRYNAQRAKREGIGRREKLLGDPIALGKLASPLAPLANRANAVRFHRIAMEKMVGIHRDKKLPDFHSETFEKWLASRPGNQEPRSAATDNVVALFHTCFVNYNDPQIGKDAVDVLERSDVNLLHPEQTCCGMPALDGGDFEFAKLQARRNVNTLAPIAKRGGKIVAINPTCSYMLKKEYVELVGPDLADDAASVAAAARDLGEFLSELRRAKQLNQVYASSPGKVRYHVPCHLRAQNIGYRSREIMRTIDGVDVSLIERCCGHDGTWAMKVEHFEESLNVGRRAFDEMSEGGIMATDCPLAAIQFEQATGRKPLHPVQILARAYRAEGFHDLADQIAEANSEKE